ncbi:MAG: rhomboid family intramembrane serine protease [Bacteroidota bacterium]
MTDEEIKNWKWPLVIALSLVLVIVGIHFVEYMDWIYLKHYSMKPKDLKGLKGIFTMPFLHKDWSHVWGNSTALLVLTFCLFYFYKKIAWQSLLFIYLLGGMWLWIAGQLGSSHIGASGVVYGLASFLFVSGIIRKNPRLMGISMLVAFLYGSFFWGVLPLEGNIEKRISWDGHLYGALAGTAMAFFFRKDGPQRKIYQFEIDEMLEEQELKRMEELQKILEEQKSNVKIVYHYRKEDPSKNELE